VAAALPKALFLLCAEFVLPTDSDGLVALFMQMPPSAMRWAARAIGGPRLAAFELDIALGSILCGEPEVLVYVEELVPGSIGRVVRLHSGRAILPLYARGRLSTLQVLYTLRDAREVLKGCSRLGVDYACEYGHLETAKWATARFGIGAGAFEGKKGVYALQHASANGHSAVVNWLVSTFQLAPVALLNAANSAIREGHYELAQSLMARAGAFADKEKFDKVMLRVDAVRSDFRFLCLPLLAAKGDCGGGAAVSPAPASPPQQTNRRLVPECPDTLAGGL
jgi:hypothetical protein